MYLGKLKNLEYIDRLKELKLPTLAHRRKRGDMIQAFLSRLLETLKTLHPTDLLIVALSHLGT